MTVSGPSGWNDCPASSILRRIDIYAFRNERAQSSLHLLKYHTKQVQKELRFTSSQLVIAHDRMN